MKLKDLLGKVIVNKKNKQLNTCFKKGAMKDAGLSKEELLNMNIDTKLKKLLYDD